MQCVYIVHTKYQLLTVKALVQVESPAHALFEHLTLCIPMDFHIHTVNMGLPTEHFKG